MSQIVFIFIHWAYSTVLSVERNINVKMDLPRVKHMGYRVKIDIMRFYHTLTRMAEMKMTNKTRR